MDELKQFCKEEWSKMIQTFTKIVYLEKSNKQKTIIEHRTVAIYMHLPNVTMANRFLAHKSSWGSTVSHSKSKNKEPR